MKLSECVIGTPVEINSEYHESFGHIVGFTHNVHPSVIESLPFKQRWKHTIPLVRFPDGSETGIHQSKLSVLNRDF